MEPDGPSNAEAVTSAASLKLPVFWHKAPKLWFAQAEAQFHIRKITSSLTKYYYTIASLPDTIATDVDDLLVPATADPYPVAHLNDFSAMLAGKKFFSKIDLIRAYQQIPVHPDDIPKTAVTTPFGLFEYTRIPFGLRNAAQTFQRFMDQVTYEPGGSA